ncbi:MAG TPA: beta-galactosidase [Candidatus Acidoferrales bacterium]|nr:beta-galactosidase [Candidatus Acidoferrales bacterium]
MAFRTAPRRTSAALLISLAAILFVARARPRSPDKQSGQQTANQQPSDQQSPEKPERPSGVEIGLHGGYPELRVDGEPFFIHSAEFFYYRMPRHAWENSLDRYRDIGINTIDLSIPWNWHELSDGTFDFDGHTHPRRDLRGLLKLIADRNLKIIARPGPLILHEWRWGGYPGWLLERHGIEPANRMDALDFLDGRYPPLAALGAGDPEAAAQGWLDSPAFMEAAGKWLEAVADELAPYASAGVAKSASGPASKKERNEKIPAAGTPLLFVQLDQGAASAQSSLPGANFWKYIASLCDSIRAGGLDVPVFINPAEIRDAAAGAILPEPIGVMGQWYMRPDAKPSAPERALTPAEASAIEFTSGLLETQPMFPPALIEYQAGWYAPGDDDRAAENPPVNTLLSSRLFLANGLHGISYYPLQDSLTPASDSVPWANQAYLWSAAFDPSGHRQRRAEAVARNGDFLKEFGPRLAASHKRADFGIVYPVAANSQSAFALPDAQRISEIVQKIERVAQLGHFSSELLDPEYQPVDQLLRDPLIFLPSFDSQGSIPPELSERAQQNFVEYVRRGGTLFVFPSRPAGKIIAQLWSEAPAAAPDASAFISASWKFGSGRVIESSKDFYSWIKLNDSFAENRAQEVSAWALQAVHDVLAEAKVRPAVEVSGNPPAASSLVVTEIVSNEGTGLLGARTRGEGWISITNLDAENTIDAPLVVLSPTTSSLGNTPDTVSLDVVVPPDESLLLPLGIPICYDETDPAPCKDFFVSSGAEYLGSVREGKSLELNFYAPTTAELCVHLERIPSHVTLQDSPVENHWDIQKQELSLSITRGAAPGYLRQLKVQLPYVPHVPVAPQPGTSPIGDYEVNVANAVRLPLGPSSYLTPFPPLVVFDDPRTLRVVFQATSPAMSKTGDLDLNITGAYRGSAILHVVPGLDAVADMMLKPASGPTPSGKPIEPDANGFLRGLVEVRGTKDRDQMPISFLTLRENGVTPYRFDYDSDGSDEWVLENEGLRLIVSPNASGRALALVSKATFTDLFSSVGGLRDGFSFTPDPAGTAPDHDRGRLGLFSRAYKAEWQPDDKNTALKLHYHAPDVYPHGATIQKIVEVDGPDAFHANYAVTLDAPPAAANGAAPSDAQPQSFVEVNSLPAVSDSVRVTRLCWSHELPAAPPAAPPAAASPAQAPTPEKSSPPSTASSQSPPQSPQPANAHCEDFVPGGPALQIPDEANHLEVRTTGRPGLALDWDSGKMSIEPKRFSVLLQLTSQPLVPGIELKTATKFRVLSAE